MIRPKACAVRALFTVSLLLSAFATNAQNTQTAVENKANPEASMKIEYLEIVTTEVDATCESLAKVHGVTFGAPEPGFGNARIASLANGGRLGVRAPMAAHEQPVVRPYLLVDDIASALGVAEAAGAQIAMAATEVPGSGSFAIYILGGIQHGLWQREPAAD